jgi:hypothetical protein
MILTGVNVFIVRIELNGDMTFYKNLMKRIEREMRIHEELRGKFNVFMKDGVLYAISFRDPLAVTLLYVIYRKAIMRGLKAVMYSAKEISDTDIPKMIKEVSDKWLMTKIGWFDKWMLEPVRLEL